MKKLKLVIFLAAMVAFAVMPIVEANYILGCTYIGTCQPDTEPARWYASGFYEGRDVVVNNRYVGRDRTVKSYFLGAPYTGTRQGRAYKTSVLTQTGEGEVGYDPMKSPRSGTRCLGCEIGAYSMVEINNRRGKYYYSTSQVAGRSKFVYTGPAIGSKSSGEFSYRAPGSNPFYGPIAARRSRLNMDPVDVATLNAEASATPVRYRLSARRYLN